MDNVDYGSSVQVGGSSVSKKINAFRNTLKIRNGEGKPSTGARLEVKVTPRRLMEKANSQVPNQ